MPSKVAPAQETETGGFQFQSQPQQFSEALINLARPCLKIKLLKREMGSGDMAQELGTPGFNHWYKKKKKKTHVHFGDSTELTCS